MNTKNDIDVVRRKTLIQGLESLRFYRFWFDVEINLSDLTLFLINRKFKNILHREPSQFYGIIINDSNIFCSQKI